MLNVLWSGMILSGILWAAVHGRLDQVTQGALASAKEAVSLCITMLGVMSLWTGILEIGRGAGLIERLSRTMRPVLRFLFPHLSPDSEAARQISINFIANILGLGWAATPAGLKAMEELKKETAIQRISKMALISDFTVVGIGGVDTNATIIKNSILTPDDYLLLKKQGAVGDILSHFIDINGNLIDTDLEKRLMSPALTDIEKYNNVVGVAGGPHKIEAIYAVLTGKYLDVLITDENTATAVLDLYQSKNNIDTERKDGALQ